MKTLKYGLLLLSLACISCHHDPEELPSPKYDSEVATEIIAEFIDDDIEKMVLSQLFNFTLTRGVAAGTQTHELNNPYEFRTRCAVKTTTNNNTQVVIDFGAGCRDEMGRFRAGKVTANLFERKENVFGRVEITLENYQYESVLVTGNRTITNNRDTHRQYAEIQSTVDDGILTFDDLSTYTYNSERNTTWDFTDQAETEFYFVTEFTKSGINRNNISFESASFTQITYNSNCFKTGIGQMTGGQFRISSEETNKTIEFKPQHCSPQAFVSVGDAAPYPIDLSELFINH
ncbi:hypothetical protein EV198_0390 [Roseivirga ehrenbergii]|uniref:Uncharacterized protein n=1 Tax=Roseivirga ehrenbergii (strain DSM 102268 / JCM 13514 / KCTC 12282 / NCIMB 14502 / KMM 6017) TaxID=279360 RepID=A0A150X8L0_ROSEK|nr:hypothetical protein [Roseivirga ehrenbergii]KYG75077.1 hypothetical protein MB14_07750 [Roseivirga ehrenbergii]TCL13561.1 hypothetical protein EV198_0390 [Roseivirga ehrenbergii]